ncbi:MAG TPA: HDOD domain-containing protein [Fimbriimonas sp.]|nr:HDOD domain-containing protein [Fimbriimonas sp.]
MQTRLPVNETMLTLSDIVRKTSDLPSSPNVALAAMRYATDPDASAAGMAKIICQDSSLVVRVLRLANSAFYGLQREVVNVSDAVVMLGLRTVRHLALLASTYPWMTRPLPGYGLGPREMWIHSLSVGVGAQVVAEKSGRVNPDLVFTAGILHDLGKTALSVWLDNKVNAMARLAELQETTFDVIERKVLGFDHQDVGAYMGEAWNLPKPLVMAIRTHHRPLETTEYAEVVYCVHVADYLSRAMGLGIGGDSMSYDFKEETLFGLHLSYSQMDQLADEMLDRYEKQERLFEVMAA